MLIGLRVLGQKPGPAPAVGIALVVVAGIGATRAGARPKPPQAPSTARTPGLRPKDKQRPAKLR
ncbi:hypothetical protein RB201_28110 [Streptomyces sp. S1A(2023)]